MFNNDYLLKQIKSRAFIPTSQKTFTDQDLLDLATDEMQHKVVPLIMQSRGEFYVSSLDYTITPESRSISIPYRAIGLAVRDVVRVDGDKEHSLALISPERKSDSLRDACYLQGNKIIVVGSGADTIRVYYHARPGGLTETANATLVSAIDRDLGVISLTSTPSNFSASALIDAIDSQPGFDLHGSDIIINSISGTDLTVNTIPTDLQIGDWIVNAQQSPVPQIPVEFYPLLAQSVAVKVLEAQGDFEGMQAAQLTMEKSESNALLLISPRIKGEAKKVMGHRRNKSNWR